MRRAWAAWWLLLPACLLIQWPGRTVVSSTGLNWAAFAAAAGALSCMESKNPRGITLALAAAVPFFLAIQYAVNVLPIVKSSGWLESFGVVASFGSTACWTLIVLFGTIAVVRYAPSPLKRLAPFFLILHGINLVLYALDQAGLYHFWYRAEGPGGFFPRIGLWAAYGLVSLPILWAWRKWAAGFALAPILLAKSLTCLWLLGLFLAWRWRRNPPALLAVILSAVLLSLRSPNVLNLIQLRLDTWIACLRMLAHVPFGIGYDPLAYETWMRSNVPSPVLAHPGSDVLGIALKHGWLAVPVIGWVGFQAVRLVRDNAIGLALWACIGLACFQKSLSFAHVGILAWVIGMVWLITRHEEVQEWNECG